MNADEPELLEEPFASMLAACDEALRAGDTPRFADDSDVPPEERRELEADLACVQILRQLMTPADTASQDGTPAPAPCVAPPSHLGRFAIRRELGRGTFGIVYLAYDPHLNREVALKVPRGDALSDPALLERFQREARAAAGLDHPHIVPVHEAGAVGPVCYIASAYCPGPTLAQWLKQRDQPVPVREAAGLAATLAEAVQHAHDRGVVHRDLKPGNVLLQEELTQRRKGAKQEEIPSFFAPLRLCVSSSSFIPKITDFGLAKLFMAEGEANQTQSGAIVGTPSYMAPEQAGGHSKAVGPAADIYALGAILYELLTGRPPFVADTTLDTLLLVRTEEPVPPHRLRPRLPRDLETVCLKCLQKEPTRRYESAGNLADDLRRFLAGEPIRARPVGTWERAWRWVKRRPAATALILVSGVAVLAVGGVVAGSFYNTRLQQEKNRAEDAVAEARKAEYFYRIAKVNTDWRDANLASVGLLLEGCPEERRGWEWHYFQRLRRLDLLTLTGHTNTVSAVVVSPDGTRLASASQDRTVRVWDLPAALAGKGNALLHELTGHTNVVHCVAFSPDGTRLASGSADKKIKLWDLKTGLPLFELPGHPDRVQSVKFSPDGTRLASAGNGGAVKVWDLETRQVLADLPGFGIYAALVQSVAFSPDGKLLAAPHPDKRIHLWRFDPEQGDSGYKPLRTLAGHPDTVQEVTFSPDGTWLASACWDGKVKVWALDGTEQVVTLIGHEGAVSGVAFSPDGARLASASNDGTVKVWNLQALPSDVADASMLTLKGHTSGVRCVAFTPDGTRIISGSYDETIKVWDSGLPQEFQTWKGLTRGGVSVAFNADESRLASTGQDGFIRIWDTATGQEIHSWKAHPRKPGGKSATDDVLWVVFSPDGKQLASSGRDGTVKVWDTTTTWKEIARFAEHTGQVNAVAFSPDGQRLASASNDLTARIWELATGRVIHELKGHTNSVQGVAFSPDGSRLATAGFDDVVKLWDATTGQLLHDLKAHTSVVWNVAFSPDGTKLASASRDQKVLLWDVSPGRAEPLLLGKLEGHKGQVSGLSFSPDGSRIASGSGDQTVRIWDVTTGRESLCLKGHTGWPRSVAFSPSGTKVASAGGDRTIKIWDAAPLTAESAIEREATGLLAGLFGRPLCRTDVIEFIQNSPMIRPQVRQKALALVNRYREESDPDRYHQAARDIVRRPYLNAQTYHFALRQAETACRLAPDNAEYKSTLDMVRNRVGQHQERRREP